eukprot:gene12064-3727_t
MWQLTPVPNAAVPFDVATLPTGAPAVEYTLGRGNENDIWMGKQDKSLSRLHAKISVKPAAGEAPARLYVTDSSSHGTLVDGTRLIKGKATQLYQGNVVTFGSSSSALQVSFRPLELASSSLDKNDKKRLEDVAATLGGNLNREFTAATTHLVMAKVKVTAKVVLTLCHAKPIVKLEWLEDIAARAKVTDRIVVDPLQMLPEIAEQKFVSKPDLFKPNPGRRTLFAGITFLVLTESQFANVEGLIKAAGGKTLLYTHHNASINGSSMHLVANTRTIMPKKPAPETSPAGQWHAKVRAGLEDSELRMISETEVTKCIIYMNTATFCNPSRPSASQAYSQSISSSSQMLTGGGSAATAPSQQPSLQLGAPSQRTTPVKGTGSGGSSKLRKGTSALPPAAVQESADLAADSMPPPASVPASASQLRKRGRKDASAVDNATASQLLDASSAHRDASATFTNSARNGAHSSSSSSGSATAPALSRRSRGGRSALGQASTSTPVVYAKDSDDDEGASAAGDASVLPLPDSSMQIESGTGTAAPSASERLDDTTASERLDGTANTALSEQIASGSGTAPSRGHSKVQASQRNGSQRGGSRRAPNAGAPVAGSPPPPEEMADNIEEDDADVEENGAGDAPEVTRHVAAKSRSARGSRASQASAAAATAAAEAAATAADADAEAEAEAQAQADQDVATANDSKKRGAVPARASRASRKRGGGGGSLTSRGDRSKATAAGDSAGLTNEDGVDLDATIVPKSQAAAGYASQYTNTYSEQQSQSARNGSNSQWMNRDSSATQRMLKPSQHTQQHSADSDGDGDDIAGDSSAAPSAEVVEERVNLVRVVARESGYANFGKQKSPQGSDGTQVNFKTFKKNFYQGINQRGARTNFVKLRLDEGFVSEDRVSWFNEQHEQHVADEKKDAEDRELLSDVFDNPVGKSKKKKKVTTKGSRSRR